MDTARNTVGVMTSTRGIAFVLWRRLIPLVVVLLGFWSCGTATPGTAAPIPPGAANLPAVPTAVIPVTPLPSPSGLSSDTATFRMAVVKVELADRLPPSGGDPGYFDGIWLLVTVQLTNKGTAVARAIGADRFEVLTPAYLADRSFTAWPSSGRRSAQDYPQALYLQLGRTTELPPGKSVVGVVIFEVNQPMVKDGLLLIYNEDRGHPLPLNVPSR